MTRWQTLLPKSALWAPTGARPHPAPVFGASGACRRGPSGGSGPSPGAAPALSPTGQNPCAQLLPPRQLHRALLPTCRLPAPGLLSEEQRSPPGPTWASRSRGTSGEGSLDFREPGFVSSGKTRGHRNDRYDREFTHIHPRLVGLQFSQFFKSKVLSHTILEFLLFPNSRVIAHLCPK